MINWQIISFLMGALIIFIGFFIIVSIARNPIKINEDIPDEGKAIFSKKMVIGVIMGLILGVIYGQSVFNNVLLGMPLGIGMGLSIAVSYSQASKHRSIAQLRLMRYLLLLGMVFLLIGVVLFLMIMSS